MADKSQKEIAEEWLKYTLKGFAAEVKRLKAEDTGTLLKSFKGAVIANAENSLQIHIAYAWYGQMVDAGLGRGTAFGDQRSNSIQNKLLGGKGRKAKPFYTKGKNGIGYQTRRLSEILGTVITTDSIQKLLSDIDSDHIINAE